MVFENTIIDDMTQYMYGLSEIEKITVEDNNPTHDESKESEKNNLNPKKNDDDTKNEKERKFFTIKFIWHMVAQ